MVTFPSLRTIPRALKLGKKNHLKKGAKLGNKGANLETSPCFVGKSRASLLLWQTHADFGQTVVARSESGDRREYLDKVAENGCSK